MIRLAIAASLTLVASLARAECQTDGIQFFPNPGAVIPTNSRFVLEGLGAEQQRVLALIGQQLTFKTVNDDDVVTAKVLKGWRSEMNRTAVLIIPHHAFKPNKRYKLVMGALSTAQLISEGADSVYWDSGSAPDDRAPKWLRKPAVTEGQYLIDHGRLVRYVQMSMDMEEQSPSYLVVTMQKAHGSTAQQTYFAPVRDGKATVGHDGCGGGFVFEDGVDYRATVLGYDIAGNLAGSVQPLEFQAPRPVQR